MVMKYVNWAFAGMCENRIFALPLSQGRNATARNHRSTDAFPLANRRDVHLLYFCPVDKCNETVEVVRRKAQVPGGTDIPDRPVFARPQDQ